MEGIWHGTFNVVTLGLFTFHINVSNYGIEQLDLKILFVYLKITLIKYQSWYWNWNSNKRKLDEKSEMYGKQWKNP